MLTLTDVYQAAPEAPGGSPGAKTASPMMQMPSDCVAARSDALNAYVTAKLGAITPKSDHRWSYSELFAEACRLCSEGYDFNLVVYEPPTDRYIPLYRPARGVRRVTSRLLQRWARYEATARRFLRLGNSKVDRRRLRRNRDDGYNEESTIDLVYAGLTCKWALPTRYLLMPEGRLSYKLCLEFGLQPRRC